MKLSITRALLIATSAWLMAACGADEPSPAPGHEGDAIAFGIKAGNSTRDAISYWGDIRSFTVWGWANDEHDQSVMLFDSQPVVQQQFALWTYSPPVYWMPNRVHRFFAVASNKDIDSRLTVTASRQFTTWESADTINFTAAQPYDEDILHALYECETLSDVQYPAPVMLNFRHMLSQLRFEVKGTEIDGCQVKLHRVTFTPKNISCTFVPQTIVTETIIPPASPGGDPIPIYTYDVQPRVSSVTPAPASEVMTIFDGQIEGHGPLASSDRLLLVPGQVGIVHVEYELWQQTPHRLLKTFDETYTIDGAMLSGHSYVATLYLPSARNIITLQASLEPWGDDNDTDREILSI